MIVPMKHLSLVCLRTDGEDALKALRDLGCVHVEPGETISDRRRNAIGAYEDSRSALRILSSLDRDGPARSVKVPEIAGTGLFDSEAPAFDAENPVGSVLALDEERLRMGAIASRLAEMEELYSIFGDLNPESISALASEGLNVVLLRISQSMRSRIDELFEDVRNQDPSALVRVCGLAGKSVLCAVVSRLADVSARAMKNGIEVIPAPSFSVSQMRNLQDRVCDREQAAYAELRKAAQAIRQIETISGELGSMAEFEVVADSLAGDGALSWISGWVPADREDDLRNAAKLHSWGVLLRDPAEGENPPVLLRPPRCFRPVVALFKGLGIAPAYREADISVPFFCFFSILLCSALVTLVCPFPSLLDKTLLLRSFLFFVQFYEVAQPADAVAVQLGALGLYPADALGERGLHGRVKILFGEPH